MQKEHSQFFEVRNDDDDAARQPCPTVKGDVERWSEAWTRASQHFDNVCADDTIRPGAVDEVNPWLRRTGWIPYLEGCDRRDILRSIREPVVEEDDVGNGNEEVRQERMAATIWRAMGEVASISQTTVSRSGVMLRFEAIRTESNKISYHPLEPYQDRS